MVDPCGGRGDGSAGLMLPIQVYRPSHGFQIEVRPSIGCNWPASRTSRRGLLGHIGATITENPNPCGRKNVTCAKIIERGVLPQSIFYQA